MATPRKSRPSRKSRKAQPAAAPASPVTVISVGTRIATLEQELAAERLRISELERRIAELESAAPKPFPYLPRPSRPPYQPEPDDDSSPWPPGRQPIPWAPQPWRPIPTFPHPVYPPAEPYRITCGVLPNAPGNAKPPTMNA